MFKTGDSVKHPFHGAGTISSVSPDGKYATVRYQSVHSPTGYYTSTHATSDLKDIRNG